MRVIINRQLRKNEYPPDEEGAIKLVMNNAPKWPHSEHSLIHQSLQRSATHPSELKISKVLFCGTLQRQIIKTKAMKIAIRFYINFSCIACKFYLIDLFYPPLELRVDYFSTTCSGAPQRATLMRTFRGNASRTPSAIGTNRTH